MSVTNLEKTQRHARGRKARQSTESMERPCARMDDGPRLTMCSQPLRNAKACTRCSNLNAKQRAARAAGFWTSLPGPLPGGAATNGRARAVVILLSLPLPQDKSKEAKGLDLSSRSARHGRLRVQSCPVPHQHHHHHPPTRHWRLFSIRLIPHSLRP